MILPFDIKFENVKPIVLIRGAGDLATGVIQALHRAGFSLVATEVPEPSAIRRSVALCEAVYDGRTEVEDCEAQLCSSVGEALELLEGNAQVQSQTAPATNDMNGDRHVDESEQKAKPKEPAHAVTSGTFLTSVAANKQEQETKAPGSKPARTKALCHSRCHYSQEKHRPSASHGTHHHCPGAWLFCGRRLRYRR